MSLRPPLQANYSQNHTTLYVGPQVDAPGPTEAFVFCQWKKRACRRDSFGHGVHTALFSASKVVRSALCLKPPAETMAFPLRRQGQEPRSPLRPVTEDYMS